MLITSALITVMSAVSLICMCAAIKAPDATLIVVPMTIFSLVCAATAAPVAFLFKRDKICFIAFIVYTLAAVMSAAAITVWQTAF